MIKDTDELPGEEMHRARSGRVQRARASVPWSWSESPSQYMDMLSNQEALRISYYWDFMEARLRRQSQF